MRRESALACLILCCALTPEMRAQTQTAPPQWSVRATDHFDIYFKAAERNRIDAVAREAERAYARISNLLRYDLATGMDVIVVRSDADLPKSPSQAVALVRASGASTRDHLLLSMEAFDTRGSAVLAHELTHQFTYELLPNWQRIGWVAEALADLHAATWEPSELATLRDAIADGRIPEVERLTASDRHWGHAVFEFVATEYGARGVRAYLTALRDYPTAARDPIRVAFDTTPADFNAAFRTFVTTRFGGR